MMRKSPQIDRNSFIPLTTHRFATAMFACWLCTTLAGCQSLKGFSSEPDASLFDNDPAALLGSEYDPTISANQAAAVGNGSTGNVAPASAIESPGSGVVTAGGVSEPGGDSNVVQADGDALPYFESHQSGNRVVSFLKSLREDLPGAKQMYQRGDALFRQAKRKPKDAVKDFARAADYFHKAGDSAPGSALQQDALFMQAESHFFANELNDATKAYQKLQKEFPRNRHNDRVAARLFTISKYWLDASKAGADPWYRVNLFDSKLPSYDAKKQAISVLDQIRYDDPTGRLADDATMMAAAEYVRQGEFEKADEFLTDLRETFTDSDHMFIAHLLGIRCKLQIYAGPEYSGLVLEEAETLVRQTRERFPDRLQNQKYSEMVARASREVSFHQAERLARRAEYRENRKEYGAAAAYYQKLASDYPSTPQAKMARAKLPKTNKLRPIPEQRLAWLTKIFPDSKKSTPLKVIDGRSQSPRPTSKTMLR